MIHATRRVVVEVRIAAQSMQAVDAAHDEIMARLAVPKRLRAPGAALIETKLIKIRNTVVRDVRA